MTDFTRHDSPVTVVLLCYNHERYVECALTSIAEQTLLPARLIVVDDASIDGSVERARGALSSGKGDIRFVIHEKNQGIPKSLNQALGLVDTPYIVLMAADDWMESDRIRSQVERLEELGSRYGAVYSDMFVAEEDGRRQPETYLARRQRPLPQGEIFRDCINGHPIPAPSVLMRMKVFEAVGIYDEQIPFEDYDMWLRISRCFEFACIDEPLVNYRAVHSSMSRTKDLSEWHLVSLRKHIDAPAPLRDEVLAHIEALTKRLYFQGRSPQLTRDDILRVVRSRPRPRSAALLATSVFRLPGPFVERSYAWLLASRARLHDVTIGTARTRIRRSRRRSSSPRRPR